MTVKNVKRLVLAALAGSSLIAAAQQPARPFDILITNARIIDGTGAPAAAGSVGVRDGKIVEVGTVSGPAATTIDAGGRALAPGFIEGSIEISGGRRQAGQLRTVVRDRSGLLLLSFAVLAYQVK